MAASYPTSVKTFSAKNTGDVIEDTHVEDLQDEVNAIEDQLLNGVDHAVTFNGVVTLAADPLGAGDAGNIVLGVEVFS